MGISRPEPIKDRAILFNVFRQVERCLWEAGTEPGLPRFLEVAPLLFLKLEDERHGAEESLWQSLKGAEDKTGHLNTVVIPGLQTRHNAQGIFAATKITREDVVKKIITILDNCHLASFDSDIIGDAFEYFLKKNAALKQSMGQYFTPRPIAKMMAALVSPTQGDAIYDPFCGAGGLLIEAFNHIKGFDASKESLFFGKDASAAARAAQLNAILHWGCHSGIEEVANTFAHPLQEKYSIGLTNVPFARDPKNYPYDECYENGLARKKTDVLSILHLFQAVKTGGRMAAIVPEGFLLGTERSIARKFLTDNADLKFVISLPHKTFLPYTMVRTAIIYLENIRCPTQKKHFWYFDVEHDGCHSLDAFQGINLNGASEEGLAALGGIKVDFEQLRQNHESWIGRQYSEGSSVPSPYPLVPLGKLVTFISTGFSYDTSHLSDNGIPLFTLKSVKKELFPNCETKFLKYEIQTHQKSACAEGDILLALKDTNRESPLLGKATIANVKGVFSSDLIKVEIDEKDMLLSEYLYYFFRNDTYASEIRRYSGGSIVKSISLENMAAIKIPLPPLTVQQEVVREFKVYERMITAQNETANFFHGKCQERLRSLWG